MCMLRTNSRRLTAAGVLLCFATALLVGCPGLPKDWPIKELTLPPGSSVAEMPHRMNDMRTNVTQLPGLDKIVSSAPKYKVAFNCEGGWDKVTSSVDGQLTPLGYTKWSAPTGWQGLGMMAGLTGATNIEDVVRIYSSPKDPYTIVVFNVGNLSTKLDEGGNEEGDFVMEITEKAAPAS